jgi:hypothetical protein
MSKHNEPKFTVKKYRYKNGMLQVFETVFEILDEAIEFLMDSSHRSAKIIDHGGRVIYSHGVHDRDHHERDNYA